MFNVISLGLLSGLFSSWGEQPPPLEPLQQLAWEELALFSLPHPPQENIELTQQNYLQDLSQFGLNRNSQGVWVASRWWTFAQYRGTVPQSAASLTKLATSLAAVEMYGPDHQFETVVKHTGSIEAGILQGDLIIEGDGDPFLVWEEGIALGNRLNSLGIRQVQGNLIVTGDFYLNYQADPIISARLLTQALNSSSWSRSIETQYQTLPPDTPRPQVQILGEIQAQNPETVTGNLLFRRRSLPLKQILQQMNIYSNNKMADLIVRSMGGVKQLSDLVVELTGVPASEVQLINGSGLGMANRLSPRAVAEILRQLDDKLQADGSSLAEILPVSGIKKGTIEGRSIPLGIPAKTGSLWNVSALAGVIPTQRHGSVYFVIINQNGNLATFRQQQDQLLQNLTQHWILNPYPDISTVNLGDPTRNL